MTDRLDRLRSEPVVRWMGLMSGTSCDGIDVAVLDIAETDSLPRATLVSGGTMSFDPSDVQELKNELDADPAASSVASWDRWFGDRFAHAARSWIDGEGEVDAIVLSGHTVAHRPDRGTTLQVGNPFIVAKQIGCPVVFGLRAADVANGGEGAPLVPAGDRILFAEDDGPVAVVNLGGISNVTWLSDRRSDPQACDCGPCNLILDQLVHRGTSGQHGFDRDGERALRGRVHRDRVERWMRHPYFANGRRSTGREEFGESWVSEHAAEWETLSLEDRLSTAADWVAECVGRVIDRYRTGEEPRVLVGGGGASNRAVMSALGRRFDRVEGLTRDTHGVEANLREAAAFAVLGHELLHQRPGSFPTTTGCREARPTGAWVV